MNQIRRTLLLTGASRGIGHATVKRFSSAGWRVITCSRQPFPENCPWEMGPEDHIQVDLADPADTERAIDEIRGAPRRRPPRGPRQQCRHLSEGRRRRADSIRCTRRLKVWQPGLPGELLRARSCWPVGSSKELAEAKGSVVNVTSIAGSRVHPFAGAAYATSKAALAGLTREMAADFAPHGIRVNAIAPGEIDTSILSPGTEKIVEQIPMRRLGTPDEVAKIIYVLCTETSSYLNGAEIHINGGQHV